LVLSIYQHSLSFHGPFHNDTKIFTSIKLSKNIDNFINARYRGFN